MWKNCFKRLRGSLTARIFLATALILIVACAATYFFIAWATPLTFQSIEMDKLNEQVDILLNDLQETTLENSGPVFEYFITKTGASLLVTDESGVAVDLPVSQSLAYSGIITENKDSRFAVTEDTAVITTITEGVEQNSGEVVWSSPFAFGGVAYTSSDWNVPLSFKDDDTVYGLAVVADITAVNQTVEAMGKVLPFLVIIVLLISLLGAVFYSRYITRPIVRLSNISQKMADLDFSWQCQEQRTDEIGVLGKNLDSLSQRLSAALTELKDANAALQEDIEKEWELERQRSAFFSAASHELKTPITVLKGQLSGMLAGVDVYQDRDKYLARSLSVTGRMEKLIQEMLTIARMEKAGGLIKQAQLDLSRLVAAQLESAEDLAVQRGMRVETDIAPDVTVIGDETLLGRAIMNLLANALTYSPAGAVVKVRLSVAEQGPLLTVENSNAHIPEDALPHLFEAFYRVEGSRNRETGGSGLGLYLTKMIFERHGATCEITNYASGVLATAAFPACAG